MSEQNDADLLNEILKRAQEDADRLDRQMHGAETIKAREEAASQHRLEEMWMREHERQQQIAAQQAEQRRQEQMLVRAVLIVAALLVFLVIALALLIPLLT